MDNYLYHLKMGKRFLRSHQPEKAIKHYKQAIDLIPVSKKRELQNCLYYMGISLKKMNSGGAALKSWLVARQSFKRGHASLMVKRFSNRYGMVRQQSSDKDDWKAFYSIQASRYLMSRGRRRFGSIPEKDMIWDLIFDSFKTIKHTYCLESMNVSDKLKLFSATKIIFPFVVIPEFDDHQVISFDFQQKKSVQSESLCPCHSGLPYSMCCGRTCCQDEIESGRF